jgi:hypothetical protein
VLDPAKGSLFGAIAETVPVPQPRGRIGHPPARVDWVGRPEQTNVRLNNPRPVVGGRRHPRPVESADAVRDLKELQPLFLKRLKDSFVDWDMRDGKAALDTGKRSPPTRRCFSMISCCSTWPGRSPTTATSRSKRAHSTVPTLPEGGGRTVDANSIDILSPGSSITIASFLQGGAPVLRSRA